MFSFDNGVTFDTLLVEKVYHLDDDTTMPSCNLSIKFIYPVESGKMNLADLQQIFVTSALGNAFDSIAVSDAVAAYINNYIDNYKSDASIYRNNISDLDAEERNEAYHYIGDDDSLDKPTVFYSYYETLSDTIVYNNRGVLSFQVRQANSKDDLVSYNSYRNFVVNFKTGTLLTESDIFIPGYDLALRKIFIATLLEQNNVKTINDLEDLGYFGIEEIMPNKNFLVTDKGITYTFNKGEYSAYQLKSPAVFIPYDLITTILKNNTVVYKLAEN
jgi:hypothetical protein